MNNVTPHKNIIYLKLPLYVRDYIADKYGGQPVVLTRHSVAWQYLQGGFYRNVELRMMSKTCHCPAVVSERGIDVSGFLSLVLPDEYVMKGLRLETNAFCCLTKDNEKKTRAALSSEFWRDLFLYVEDTEINGRRMDRNYRPNVSAAILDFMISSGINIDHYETVVRNYKREKLAVLKKALK